MKMKAGGLVFLYTALFSTLDLLRHFSYTQNSNDVATFDQSLWFFLHGQGFYNSIEGMSHLGVHSSPILFLLLPFYALFPSPVTLIVLQCFACALAIPLVFLIGEHLMDERAGFCYALLFSLYHPLHGVSWDIVNELCFAIAPLLFAYYGYLKNRPFLLWIGAVIAMMCKEEIGLVIGFFGLFIIAQSLLGKEKKWRLHGALLFAMGFGWTFFSLDILIPHFRGAPYQYFSSENRYTEFGSSLGTIVFHILTKPAAVFRLAFTLPKLIYCLELLVPLGFLSLAAPATLWMAIPALSANLLSNSEMMSMVGARYPAAYLPYIFISAIHGTKKVLSKSGTVPIRGQSPVQNRIFKTQLTITLLCVLFSSYTPLRIPFKVPKITPHCAVVRKFIEQIPSGSVVSTQPNFTAHIAHGCRVSPFFRPDAQYVLLDFTFAQSYRDSGMSPLAVRNKGYKLIGSKDGVVLLRKDFPKGTPSINKNQSPTNI